MAKILAIVCMWAIGETVTSMSLDGCNGFERHMVTPDELETLAMDSVAKARKFDHVDRVTVESEQGLEEWVKREDGSWLQR